VKSFSEWLLDRLPALLFLLFMVWIVGTIERVAEDERLINLCMADGHKEYECKTIFARTR